MKFKETHLKGAFVIEIEPRGDERGFFARAFCKRELAQAGLNAEIVQINNSLSRRQGTLRGIHYQLAPKAEEKIVRCIRGALYDAIVDMRPDSPTFLQHFGVELTAENRKALYVPKGFGHAFLSLKDDTETLYMVTEYYAPDRERGLRYDDPQLAIPWPISPMIVSDKDRAWPDFSRDYHLA
jgi:dTDP-4-dehydrorhamnose 3,5-epimerase